MIHNRIIENSHQQDKQPDQALLVGIENLYHFQHLDFARLLPLLKDRKIYCSKPENFNDPWDCKIWRNTEILDDPQEYERCIQYIASRPSTLSKDEHDYVMQRISTDRSLLETYLNPVDSPWLVNGISRVYCLTPANDNLLFWSHYADSHKGICLEFSTSNVVIGSAWKVEYVEDYPLYKFGESGDIWPLLTKAKEWAYEKEYRIIAHERNEIGNYDVKSLILDDGFLTLPEGSLKSIIVGCQMSEQKLEELNNFVGENSPGLLIRRAKQKRNKYAVEIY